jgi:hypothetical protein
MIKFVVTAFGSPVHGPFVWTQIAWVLNVVEIENIAKYPNYSKVRTQALKTA